MTDVWIFLKFAKHSEIVAVNNAFNFREGGINYSGLRLLIQVMLPILNV